MERRRRERSRSPVDVKESYREKYSREHDKDRKKRNDVDNKIDKSSLHHRGEREYNSRSDPRERDRRDHNEKYNHSRREEDDERGNRHRSNTERHDHDRQREHKRDSERTSRPGRDRSQERITQRTDDQRDQGNRRHDFRQERDQNEEQRGQRRPGYQRRQRGHRRESDDEPDDSSRYGRPAGEEGTTETAVEAEKPNFGLSGKLTEYTNTYKGVVIKYNEPPEGRKPKTRWRLYPFKGEEGLPVLYIHRQSAYLLGRQRHIADIPIDHPSCSKQHAVLQYRLANYERPDGTTGRKVKPYIIDLESANGTFLNNQKIEPRRYYELKERDVLKFGFSSREYVILHEKSSNAEEENTGEPASSGSDSSAE